MKHCHFCGAELRDGGHRRVVQTGQSRRDYHGQRRTSVAYSTSQGWRNVCTKCSGELDERAAEEARQAVFRARMKFGLCCCAALLAGIAYMSQPPKSAKSISVIGQNASAASPLLSNVREPTETASIAPSPTPAPDEAVAPPIPAVPMFPQIEGNQHLLDPNFPPDAERVQVRLRTLGYSISDPPGA
jgi:hypothetical protein